MQAAQVVEHGALVPAVPRLASPGERGLQGPKALLIPTREMQQPSLPVKQPRLLRSVQPRQPADETALRP